MPESITVGGGSSTVDWDGNLVPASPGRVIDDVIVYPVGESRIDQVDVDGSTTRLELLAPAGTVVAEGERVEVRGQVYKALAPSFDWNSGRRPVLSRHKPRVKIVVERGAG